MGDQLSWVALDCPSVSTENPAPWETHWSGAISRWLVTLVDIQAKNPFAMSIMEGPKCSRPFPPQIILSGLSN